MLFFFSSLVVQFTLHFCMSPPHPDATKLQQRSTYLLHFRPADAGYFKIKLSPAQLELGLSLAKFLMHCAPPCKNCSNESKTRSMGKILSFYARPLIFILVRKCMLFWTPSWKPFSLIFHCCDCFANVSVMSQTHNTSTKHTGYNVIAINTVQAGCHNCMLVIFAKLSPSPSSS